MGAMRQDEPRDLPPPLPERVPVEMPELPACLVIRSMDQYKAIADPTRTRVLGIIQNEPATAKQIADRLHIAPGTAAHHLRVLEEAGLARIAALRMVRGITAKYYTRTARIFSFELPPEVTGARQPSLEIVAQTRDEVGEALADFGADATLYDGLARARLSPAQVERYKARVSELFDAFSTEVADPDGQVYALGVALFRSPSYLQRPAAAHPPAAEGPDDQPRGGAL
jgi:DNA-binding transcriptional ArsR family regulator